MPKVIFKVNISLTHFKILKAGRNAALTYNNEWFYFFSDINFSGTETVSNSYISIWYFLLKKRVSLTGETND